jgi:hypothetical protein
MRNASKQGALLAEEMPCDYHGLGTKNEVTKWPIHATRKKQTRGSKTR